MRKLVAIYRTYTDNNTEIRIFKSKSKVRAEVYSRKPFKRTGKAVDRDCLDVDTFLKLDGENRMLKLLGIVAPSYSVPFEIVKNKVIAWPKRIIFSNMGEHGDYDEWKKEMLAEGENPKSLTHERFSDSLDIWLDDERSNLDIDVADDYTILGFADLGLWYGRRNGVKDFGTNIASILNTECDYAEWYCDRKDLRATFSHHDGTNYILYRMVKNSKVDDIINRICNNGMDENAFIRETKSLRPLVADVYGW